MGMYEFDISTLMFNLHSPKNLATLDGEIVDTEIAVKLKCGIYLKYTMYTPNIYTLSHMECNSMFYKIGMRKYPWKSFQW